MSTQYAPLPDLTPEQDIHRSPDFGSYPVPWQRRLRDYLTPQALLPTWEVNGIDVSAWNKHMDWSVTASRGIKFAYIRAGYGEVSVDTFLNANRQGCVDNAIEYGLYWFLHIGRSFVTTARSFYNAAVDAPGKLYAVADCEYSISGMTKASRYDWIRNFVTELEYRFGKEVAIYSSPGWWNGNVLTNSWANTKKLFNAHWTTASAPILPSDWSRYGKSFWLWQHSADWNGLGRDYGSIDGDVDMDLDRYNGTLARFNEEFGLTPPPIGIEPIKRVKVTADALNIRSGPAATYSDLGTLVKNDDVPLVAITPDGQWGRLDGWIKLSYTQDV